jgi:hypothetical protein
LQPSCITAVLLSESGGEGIRGDDNQQEGIFSYISPEKRVPGDHPMRPIRKLVDEMLRKVKLRGIGKVGWLFTFTGAAYNLCRLRNLMAQA